MRPTGPAPRWNGQHPISRWPLACSSTPARATSSSMGLACRIDRTGPADAVCNRGGDGRPARGPRGPLVVSWPHERTDHLRSACRNSHDARVCARITCICGHPDLRGCLPRLVGVRIPAGRVAIWRRGDSLGTRGLSSMATRSRRLLAAPSGSLSRTIWPGQGLAT